MDSGLKKAFKKASYHPERRLSDDILLSILKREQKRTTIKFWIYSIISGFSLAGLFPAVKLLLSDFSKSGFYDYVSLLLSGNKIILYWKEIMLSITESIPMSSLILMLVLVFVLGMSLRFMVKNIRVRSKLLSA